MNAPRRFGPLRAFGKERRTEMVDHLKSGAERRLICAWLGQGKIALGSIFVAMIVATMLLSSGCEEKTRATNPTSQSTPGSTKPLEAADLVGYDGKRLRKSVDRIKEANEKRGQELEKMAGSGPDQ